jgi:23S rRNA pseudouridine2605 synthase
VAASADRAAFADVRAPRRPSGSGDKGSTWSPRDSRPAEERAARPAPAGAKPKRFYDAKPKGGGKAGAPADTRPARVFNPELGRNVRAKPPRPPRDEAAPARPSRTGPAPTPDGKPRPKTGWAKPKPKPRTRK